MKVFNSISSLESIEKGVVLTIGNFDGVHLGHQEIMKTARAARERFNANGLAVITFEPHSKAIIHPENAPGILTSLDMKIHYLKQCGVDYMIVLSDSFGLLNLTPVEFVDEFLMKMIHPVVIVEGPDFNFGRGRSGDIWTLRKLGSKRGFKVIVTEPKCLELSDGQPVACSSLLVRDLLVHGRVESAAKVLGKPYRLVGRVAAELDRKVYPNFTSTYIEPREQIVPAEGVYAGFVEINDSFDMACTSIGQPSAIFNIRDNKTFAAERRPLIKAHVLNTDTSKLLGKWLAMDFVRNICCYGTFNSERESTRQIVKDCEEAKNILAAI